MIPSERLQAVLRTIAAVSDRPVRLVAVTKHRSADEIRALIQAGVTEIGENRWQEAREKLPLLPAGITRHFIGRLQTNKAKEVALHFDCVESVDRAELAQALEKACAAAGKTLSVLAQVNVSAEPQKGGAAPESAEALCAAIAACPHLKLDGLMTIGRRTTDPEEARAGFRTLKTLFDRLRPLYGWKTLSMGMSDDFKIALEEGATLVRLGRILFED